MVAPAAHPLRLPRMQKRIPGRRRARRLATLTWIALLRAMLSWSTSSCNNLIVYIFGLTGRSRYRFNILNEYWTGLGLELVFLNLTIAMDTLPLVVG